MNVWFARASSSAASRVVLRRDFRTLSLNYEKNRRIMCALKVLGLSKYTLNGCTNSPDRGCVDFLYEDFSYGLVNPIRKGTSCRTRPPHPDFTGGSPIAGLFVGSWRKGS